MHSEAKQLALSHTGGKGSSLLGGGGDAGPVKATPPPSICQNCYQGTALFLQNGQEVFENRGLYLWKAWEESH